MVHHDRNRIFSREVTLHGSDFGRDWLVKVVAQSFSQHEEKNQAGNSFCFTSEGITMIRYLATIEVADYFRVSVSVVKRWIRENTLPGTIDIGTVKKPNYSIPEASLSRVIRNPVVEAMPDGIEKFI